MNKNRPIKPQETPPERFQPKVFLIWLAIIAIMAGVWTLFPENKGPASEQWTLQKVLEEANDGNIVSGKIKADPNRGHEWYLVQGNIIQQTTTGREAEKISFKAQGRLTEKKFNELTDSPSGVNLKQQPASTLLTDILVGLLPFLLIIALLYFLFIRQLKMAGKGAMSFGKSRAKMLTRDSKMANFKDVAGCEEAIEEVQEIVDFLKEPKKFQNIGGRVPKGVLLVGPPGTGKTLLARAVAGEAEVPFFTISGSDFVEMFVGVGASRVRDMFDQGKKNSPCIIFIDEIDAVGRQRGAGLGGGNDEREQTLNSLLVEMDGFDPNDGVIIIAATNRPDVLDNALLRPGRFDRQVTIDLPDLHGREEILNVHGKKVKLSDKVELMVAARNTPGFSGADLENLLNEAALIAARYNKNSIEPIDIDEAREKIAFGRERRKLMDDEDKKITAVHEAGHAIVQAVIDDGYLPIHKVTIIPRGQSLGSTMFVPKKDILNQQKNRILNQICCAMGGRIAEEIVLDIETSGASGDIQIATKLARRMVCDWGMSSLGPIAFGDNKDHVFLGREISRDQNYSESTAQKIDSEIHCIVENEYKRATEILIKHREPLDKLADALLEFETVEGKHVHEILDYCEIRSEIHPPKISPRLEEKMAARKKKEQESEDIGHQKGYSVGAPA